MTTGAARYRQIADDIERRIGAGELRPGDPVPSIRRITRDWGVAMATATRALSELTARGTVRVVPGVGTVVADAAQRGVPPGRAERQRPGTRSAGPPAPDRTRTNPARINPARIIEAAIAVDRKSVV